MNAGPQPQADHQPTPERGDVDFTLLMPCLNEAQTLGTCIDKALDCARTLGIRAEVLIADNGSDDGSVELAERHGARVVHVEFKGYGSALRHGIAAARGRWVIFADADDSYDWSNLEPFVERLRQGADLVMGCRLPAGGGTIKPGAMPFLHRWLGNPVLSLLGRVLFGTDVVDFHCGMRGLRKEAVEKLHLRSDGMEFASEMVIKAALYDLRIDQVPITLHPDGRERPPHLRTWRDGWRHLRFMLMCSPVTVFLAPGLVFAALGVAGFGLLLPGPLSVGSVTFDVNTLIIAGLSLLVGTQALTYGLGLHTFAVNEGFLPPDRWYRSLRKWFSLELGLVTGAALLVMGCVLLLLGVSYWGKHDFGSQPYAESVRLVFPSFLAIVLGMQTFFASFFFSSLFISRMPRSTLPAPDE